MEIYLIRHTSPEIDKGVCYGQADLDVTGSFLSEAAIIQKHLPARVTAVYSSPLWRCKKLAEHLFAGHAIQLHNDLMEINCGQWELKLWDDIPKHEIDPWMKDVVNVRIPGGESYADVYERVAQCFNTIVTRHAAYDDKSAEAMGEGVSSGAVIIAHGGVIRSILSHITHTPLAHSFKVFSLHYGCVVKVFYEKGAHQHEVLSNIPHEKETHKPSNI